MIKSIIGHVANAFTSPERQECKKVFNDFVDFVRGMPAQCKLQHGSWEACAVGDYARARLAKDPSYIAAQLAVVTGSQFAWIWDDVGAGIELTEDDTLMDVLDDGGFDIDGNSTLESYGDLQELIAKFGY